MSAVLDRGRKIAEGTPAEVQRDPGRDPAPISAAATSPWGAKRRHDASRPPCRNCCGATPRRWRPARRCAKRTSASGRPIAGGAIGKRRGTSPPGLAAHGFKARRQAGGDRREPAAALFRAAGGAVPRRHRGAGLPGRDRRRARLCARPRRGVGGRRRGPGAGRQGPVAEGPSCRISKLVVYDDPRGLRRLRRPAACSRSRRCRKPGARSARRSPDMSRPRSMPASPTMICAVLLHFGDDRRGPRA